MPVPEAKYKSKLIQTSEEQKRALQKDVEEVLGRANQLLTTGLLIGGGLFVSYYLFKAIFSSDRPSKKKAKKTKSHTEAIIKSNQPTLFSSISNTLVTHVMAFILEILRRKLIEYLDNLNNLENEDSENS